MNRIELQPGDVFCVDSPGIFSSVIKIYQRILGKDNKAIYSHAGIILDSTGNTFEALKKIDVNHLDKYIGRKILIARPLTDIKGNQLTSEVIQVCLDIIQRKNRGKKYPWWRIILRVLPFLAKISIFGIPVCNELVGQYLQCANVRDIQWSGGTPDDLAEELKHWKNYKIICEENWDLMYYF